VFDESDIESSQVEEDEDENNENLIHEKK